MQYLVKLTDRDLKIYYSEKVYSPEHSSMDTIAVAHKAVQGAAISVLDVGCGSGVLGLGLKALNPQISLYMSDVDKQAVKIAKLNARRLGLRCRIFKVELVRGEYDMIIANLPTYTQEQMDRFFLYGPEIAYFGDGLKLYERLFAEARCRVLVCECQVAHQKEFLKLAKKNGWKLMLSTGYSFGFIK